MGSSRTDEKLEEVAEWIIRRRSSESVALGAIRDVGARHLLEGNVELQVVMYKWRMIMDEGEMPTSHLSEEGVELPKERDEVDVADYDVVDI